MIQVVPLQDLEKRRRLLEAAGATAPTAEILMMSDGDREVGWAAVELAGQAVRIVKLTAQGWDGAAKPGPEEIFVLDTLMRSAASYGEVFGAREIVTAFPDFYDFFKLRGFTQEADCARTPMSTIVHYE